MRTHITIPSRLSDHELVDEVARLAGSGRETTASLIAHLGELHGRRLHERAGFSSLFTYCIEVLHFSDHEAYDRMKAAKVARRYPAVLGLLASGKVNLTTIRLLAPHLTPKNHEELFGAACSLRKRQVQELVARRFPQPDAVASVRKLAAPHAAAEPGPEPMPIGGSLDALAVASLSTAGSATATSNCPVPPTIAALPPPVVQPLAVDRYRITFTADAQTRERLELAQDLLRHAIPSGDPAQIFARALDVLVEQLVKQKFSVTDRPRTGRGQADDSRNIPSEVRRAVYIRDRGRCAFVSPDGRPCGERGFLEFHHVVPYAAGGRPTVENIQLRCRAHNRYEAHVFYGPAKRYVGSFVSEAVTTYEHVNRDAFSFRNEKTLPAVRPRWGRRVAAWGRTLAQGVGG